MAQPLTITGANIKLYINNKVYSFVQSITLNLDYGETQIYGIDSEYPQEIATTKVSVSGSINGIRVKLSGGLQAQNIRPLFNDFAAGSYISIRIQDRSTQEDILFIPVAKVTRESHAVAIKQTYKLNFDFVGQTPLMALDRS